MSRLEWAGITSATRASDISALTAEGGKEAVRRYFKDLGEQTLEALRQAVGGIPLRSEVIVRLDGPVDDVLQGLIYALTVSAQVDVDDLPAGSDMLAAWERHGVLTLDPEPIL